MLLSELADTSKIFIDSNIFIYHFSKFEKFADTCLDFFQRVEEGRILAYTSTVVVSEVLHRLMIIEASQKFGLLPKKILEYLKTHPEKIALLTDHSRIVNTIGKIGIIVLPVHLIDIELSIQIKDKYNFFTNDAINISLMKNLLCNLRFYSIHLEFTGIF